MLLLPALLSLPKGKTVIGRLLGDLLMQCGVRPGKDSILEQQREEAIKQKEETNLDREKQELSSERSQLALVEAQIRKAAAQQVLPIYLSSYWLAAPIDSRFYKMSCLFIVTVVYVTMQMFCLLLSPYLCIDPYSRRNYAGGKKH